MLDYIVQSLCGGNSVNIIIRRCLLWIIESSLFVEMSLLDYRVLSLLGGHLQLTLLLGHVYVGLHSPVSMWR